MKRVIAQCLKELNQFRRDRLTVALALILPMAMLLIYGFAIRLEVKNIPLAVQDFDHSFLSRNYIERIYATEQFIPTKLLTESTEEVINRGLAKAVVVIPPDFEREIKANHPVKVQVLIDGTDVNNARVVQNSIRGLTNFFMRDQDLQPRKPKVTAAVRLWFNPGRREALYIVPGIYGVIFWVFPSMLAAIALVREKEQGTIVQVYATDLTAKEWLLGKWFAYLLVACAEAIVAMTISFILFGIYPIIEPSALIIGTLIYLGTAVAFGLFVGVRATNQNAAVQGTAILGFLTSFLLSGFIYRLENIPFPLSLLPNIIPARYYILLSRDAFVRGTGWMGVWYVPLAIAFIGYLLFNGAAKIMKNMQLPD